MPRAITYTRTASWLLYVAQYALTANAFFVMQCGVLTVERGDPIVSRGVSPAAHVHVIAGGLSFSENMTTESAQAGSCTTCPVSEDKSNYWSPMIYFNHKTKGFVASKYNSFVVYYKYEVNQGFEEFPPDFRMVAGDSALREKDDSSVEQWEMSWKITVVSLKRHAQMASALKSPFPAAAMARPTAPTTEATSSTQSLYKLVYREDKNLLGGLFSNTDFDWSEAVNPEQPMVLAMGDPTGFGLHGDFFMGWEKGVLQAALDTCDGTSDTGNTADGRVIFCPAFKNVVRAGNDVGPSTCAKPDPNAGLTYTEDVGLTNPIKTLPGCNELTSTNAEQKAAAAKCPSSGGSQQQQDTSGQGATSSQANNEYMPGANDQPETAYSQANTRLSAQGGGYVAGPTSSESSHRSAATGSNNEKSSSEKYYPTSILGEQYIGGITLTKPETLTVTVTPDARPYQYLHNRFVKRHVATQRPGSIRRRIGD